MYPACVSSKLCEFISLNLPNYNQWNELNVTCMSGSQPWEGRESYEEAQLKTKRPACPARRSPGSPARPGNDVTFLICVDTALIQSSKQQVKDTNCSQTKDKLITRTPNHSWQLCLGFMGFNAEDMRLRKRLWLAAVCRSLQLSSLSMATIDGEPGNGENPQKLVFSMFSNLF